MGQRAGEGHCIRGLLCLTGTGSWGVRIEKTPGAGLEAPFPSPSARRPLVHPQFG